MAIELESVPAEIDQVQRRLVQLELAHRQLAEETEEHARQRLQEIEDEMKDLRFKLANVLDQLSYNAHDDNSVNPIAPRQFLATFSYKF